MFGDALEAVRCRKPLILNVTNFVTVNDVANMLLAAGAAPVMSDDPADAAQMAALSRGVNLNIGTVNGHSIQVMLEAGRAANRKNIPAVLDPVGAGATARRTEVAQMLPKQIHFSAVKGNMSEIRALFGGVCGTNGVDAAEADEVTPDNLPVLAEEVRRYAFTAKTVIAVTGAIDLVTDGNRCYCIRNGRPEMQYITGTGCMLSGLIAAFLAEMPENRLQATAEAVCAMGICGEIGYRCLQSGEGNASYRSRIIDAMYHLRSETLAKEANYELF